jgi:hypothetical protein
MATRVLLVSVLAIAGGRLPSRLSCCAALPLCYYGWRKSAKEMLRAAGKECADDLYRSSLRAHLSEFDVDRKSGLGDDN